MGFLRVKLPAILGLAALLALATSTPSYANCPSPITITPGVFIAMAYQNCGKNAVGQFWAHRNANWSKVGAGGLVDNGASGNGASPTGPAGEYNFNGDWNNPFVDGCIVSVVGDGGLTGNVCAAGQQDLVPTDFVMGGQSLSKSAESVVMFGSIDLNEVFQAYDQENLGAPVADGDPCAGDAFSTNAAGAISCVVVPSPILAYNSGASSATHMVFNVSLPAQSVPYVDDCNVAASKATNCTGPAGDKRNLNAGRVLMARRGLCDSTVTNLVATYDSAVGTKTELWHPFNAGDANYDGFVDATPTVPNPITLFTEALQPGPVIDIPIATTTATDQCYYFGLAAAADRVPVAGATPWVAPYVSMATNAITQFYCPCSAGDRSCLSAGAPCGAGCGTCVANTTGATAAPDRVLDLKASKLGSGKFNASWTTSGENTIASFQLVGKDKATGAIVIKNSIAPTGGGLAASYSVDLAASDLKGSKQISVVVFYNDGSKASFGPASF